MDLHGEKVDDFALKKTEKGYILEVDVGYPKDLSKNHSELPFLAERIKIRKVDKLVSNFKDKKTYVVHIKTLSRALRHGLKLKKLHQVIRFEQSYWIKPYIMLNIRLRTAAKN